MCIHMTCIVNDMTRLCIWVLKISWGVFLGRYFRRKELSEALDIKKDAEELDAQDEEEDFSGSLCPNVRQKLWEVLEKPGSSAAARTFGTLSMVFVVVSIANMALISVELSWLAPPLLDALEYLCIAWFTAEFVLRLLCARDRCRFLRSVANIIDLLAILLFYITLLVESLCGGESSQELENVGRIVQVLRLLRALRMLKLGRHSTGTFGHGYGNSQFSLPATVVPGHSSPFCVHFCQSFFTQSVSSNGL